LLDQRSVCVVHGQALDPIAAVPGLRNRPKGIAFPDRVAACRLDASTASRLAFRLVKRHQVKLSPQEVGQALNPPGAQRPQPDLQAAGRSLARDQLEPPEMTVKGRLNGTSK
jgi:hypothetical protein